MRLGRDALGEKLWSIHIAQRDETSDMEAGTVDFHMLVVALML